MVEPSERSLGRIMARLGFDWLVVDMEHTAQNPVLMADMVATIADAGTCAPIVRILEIASSGSSGRRCRGMGSSCSDG